MIHTETFAFLFGLNNDEAQARLGNQFAINLELSCEYCGTRYGIEFIERPQIFRIRFLILTPRTFESFGVF